jgi:hypothetical protein
VQTAACDVAPCLFYGFCFISHSRELPSAHGKHCCARVALVRERLIAPREVDFFDFICLIGVNGFQRR